MPKANGEMLRRGERVIAAADLVGVPEGTAGKVSLATGISWIRYWVRFENGVERGSIDRTKLVRADEWDDYLVERERASEAAAAAAAAPAAEAGDEGEAEAAGGEAATVNGVTVPPHLLERSRSARERLGA